MLLGILFGGLHLHLVALLRDGLMLFAHLRTVLVLHEALRFGVGGVGGEGACDSLLCRPSHVLVLASDGVTTGRDLNIQSLRSLLRLLREINLPSFIYI